MKVIGKYTINDTAGVSGDFVFYKASEEASTRKFLIKALGTAEIHPEDSWQFEHEFSLLKQLNSISSYFPKVVEYVKDNGNFGIVIEDEGFKPLKEVFQRTQLPLETFLPIAIQLAKIVAVIHEEEIIHRNLTHKNILVHPETNKIQVTDFSVATELNRTIVAADPPHLLQGTLEYMAPEQTGRMNRPLTRRADLYSMGVLFYELLTGVLPFRNKVPTKLIADHIAKPPENPCNLNEEIPEALSLIVMKLLEKKSENRYKSSAGLLADIETIWECYNKKKVVFPFPLGEQDTASHWELPDKLYGRENQRDILLRVFDEFQSDQKNILLSVSGDSGIGKTSLVHELSPKIAIAEGLFATGKFNTFPQKDSFEGLRRALDKVVQYYMGSSETVYVKFRDDVIREVGSVLGIITEFIPRLEQVVGVQEKLPKVGIQQTKNRFELAMHRFIKVVSSFHPLTIFLDDLQWADSSLFDLLYKLITSNEIKNMLIIVSYRSEEVDEQHPLIAFLRETEEKRKSYKVHVEPILEEDILLMLQDILNLQQSDVSELAHLVTAKTEGNPLFILMLLEELYQDKVLEYSPVEKRWFWSNEKIEKMQSMEKLSDFINHRLKKLPNKSKDLLHSAACLGNSFTLNEMNKSLNLSISEILKGLLPALKDNLIYQYRLRDEFLQASSEKELLNREYRFVHDKIQCGGVELKPLEETEQTHLNIARNLFKAYKDSTNPFIKLVITDQFNKGFSKVNEKEEITQVCMLNHEAGQFAMEQAAYEVAFYYDRIAKELLFEEMWEQNYEYAYNIYYAFIKSSFLSQNYGESEQASKTLLSLARENIDKAKILGLKGDLARATDETANPIPFYAEGLRLIGFEKIANVPGKLRIISAVLYYKYYLNRYRTPIENLPDETDPLQELAYHLGQRICEESYYRNDPLRFAYTVAVWAVLTYSKHSKILRVFAHSTYGYIWPHSRLAYHLAKEAIEMIENSPNSTGVASSYFSLNALVMSWHVPLHETLRSFRQSIKYCEEVGNLEALALSNFNVIITDSSLSCQKAMYLLENLKDAVEDISPRGLILGDIYLQTYRNLCGICPPNTWICEKFNENKLIDACEKMNYELAPNKLLLNKMKIDIHTQLEMPNNDLKDALLSIFNKIQKRNYLFDTLLAHFYLFYSEIRCYPSASLFEKIKSRLRMRSLRRRVKGWVKLCPENYETCMTLMEAESARLRGRNKIAIELYEKAIEYAKRLKHYEYLGIANQRMLSLYQSLNEHEKVKACAVEVLRTYRDWEAEGLVKLFIEKYSDIISEHEINTEREG